MARLAQFLYPLLKSTEVRKLYFERRVRYSTSHCLDEFSNVCDSISHSGGCATRHCSELVFTMHMCTLSAWPCCRLVTGFISCTVHNIRDSRVNRGLEKINY